MKKQNQIVKIAIIVTLCLVFFGCMGCTIVALEVYSQSFGRIEESPDDEFYPNYIWKDIDKVKFPREEVCFNSGGNKLQGFIYGGSNKNGLIVISEGLGSTADGYLSLIMHFVDNGWCVFAFNNTGVSGSEGDSIRGMTQSLVDLDAALTYIKNSGLFNGLPVMLAGHSWGGYAVCAVLQYNHHVNAVVSFAGYNNGGDVVKEQGVLMVGGIYYILSPQVWAIEKQLFGDTAKLTAVDGINISGISVMIVQCSDDDVIRADTTSIYAHRGKITNPHIEIVYRDGEDAVGHNHPYHSRQKIEYRKWANTSWEEYKAEHKDASRFQWAQEVNFDKAKANELDTKLMERINVFFNNAK